MMEKTTGELLNHYAKREPKEFLQIDGWYGGKWVGDSVIATDKNGYSMTGGATVELMIGADVRILIDPSTPASEAVVLLQKAIDWLNRGPALYQTIVKRSRGEEKSNERNVDDRRTHRGGRNSEHFGGCPKCGDSDIYLNTGSDHWFLCYEHKTKWYVGSNLLCSWRHMTPEDCDRHEKTLAEYEAVEPIFPKPSSMKNERNGDSRRVYLKCLST